MIVLSHKSNCSGCGNKAGNDILYRSGKGSFSPSGEKKRFRSTIDGRFERNSQLSTGGDLPLSSVSSSVGIEGSGSKESHLVAFPFGSNRPEIVVSVLRSIRLLFLFRCAGNLGVSKVTSSRLRGVLNNIRSRRSVLGPSELKVSVIILNFSHDGVSNTDVVGISGSLFNLLNWRLNFIVMIMIKTITSHFSVHIEGGINNSSHFKGNSSS